MSTLAFDPASRSRLTHYDLDRFPRNTLFDRVARAVCAAGCLPRKELYESWEVARRVRRLFRGGRVIDAAAGHGLLAHLMLILDHTSPSAIAVERAWPSSAMKLHDALANEWPHLAARVTFNARDWSDVDLAATDIVVSVHACGRLTDEILARAIAARTRVAVLPCCHDLADTAGRELGGWLDGALAIDVARALRTKAQRYRVWTQKISSDITPKNRLLLAAPLG